MAVLILAVGYSSVKTSEKILEKSIADNSLRFSSEILDKIDRTIYRRIEIFQEYSYDLDLQEALIKSNLEFEKLSNIQKHIDKQDREWTTAPKETITPFMQNLINNRLARELREKIGFYKEKDGYSVFAEIIVTNKYGANSAITGKTTDYRQDDEEWWRKSKKDGLFLKDIEYDESSEVYSIDMGIQIKDKKGNFLGVIKVIYNVKEVINELKKMSNNNLLTKFKNTKYTLITQEGKMIYSTEKYKFFEDYSSDIFFTGQKDGLPLVTKKITPQGKVLAILSHSKGYEAFKGLGWGSIVEYDVDEIFAPVSQLKKTILIITLVVVIIAVCIGIYLLKKIIHPITNLRNAAIEIGRGKLELGLEKKSNDEIGELSDSFDKMAQNLRKTMVSKDYLDNIIKSMNDSLIVTDPDGNIKMVNKATLNVLGYAEDDLLNQPIGRIIEEEGLIFKGIGLNELIKKGLVGNVEKTYLGKDGKKIPVLFSGQVMCDRNDKTQGFVFIALDITERKKAGEAIKESERRLKEAQEVSLTGNYLLDIETREITWSDQQYNIFGYQPGEVAPTFKLVLEHVHPNDRENFIKRNEEVFATRKLYNNEYRIITKDGIEKHVHSKARVEEDTLGKLWLKGTLQDITERKRVEEKLRETQKLESLGVLAGGIAHDFNNILTGILGNSDLAFDDLSPASPVRNYIEKIQEEAKRAAELCHLMLAYSGKGKFVIENIDVNEIIKEVTHMLEISISKNHDIKNDLTENLPSVDVDITQIRQVIMNLIINASEAIGENNGVISVSTSTVECGSEGAQICKSMMLDEVLPEGQYIVIEVADTGEGMNKDTIKKIFDPFFTTKFTGRGLGMSAVLGIIRGHKGAINVESEPGKGTKFTVLLPFSTASSTAKLDSEETAASWRGSGTVLVVDDEKTVRDVTTSMLKRMGFNVITAVNGQEATEIFQDRLNEIDCVLLDLTMPIMNGEECFHELRKIRKDICVIIYSGYSDDEISKKFVDQRVNEFLQKPFRLKTLRNKMRKVFESN